MEVNGYKIEPGANLAHAGLWRANLLDADLGGRSGCSFVASASPSQAGNFLTLNAVLLAPKSRTTVRNSWGKAHG